MEYMSLNDSFKAQRKNSQLTALKIINNYHFLNNQLIQRVNSNKLYKDPIHTNIDLSSIETDSFSYQNNIFNHKYEGQYYTDNIIILKNPNEYTKVLFKYYGENNSLCNFSIFEKYIDINMNLNTKKLKKITLYEYLDIFNEPSFLSMNIPYINQKGNVSNIIFSPTLSSMNLIIKAKKIKKENINKKYLKDNFSLNFISNDLIKMHFNENNPPYNRDAIKNKISIIHKILGNKKILLDDIIKDNSYFSILWTPLDIYKNKSSFLSFYTFDFKLIGTLILKIDDNSWFTIFVNDKNNYKSFKKEYLIKVNIIENIIKKYNNIKDGDDILEYKLYSYDYKCFLYNN